jgi:hypothetical protein
MIHLCAEDIYLAMDKSYRFNITLDPRIASELKHLMAQRKYPSQMLLGFLGYLKGA